MTTASLTSATRDPFMPQRPPGMRTGLGLALLAHALLIAGLAYSVDWHASEPAAVEAELWSALPQQAAPRPVEAPPPPPAPAPAPPPPPAPKPQPAPPPQVDPQIAIEKAREAKRVQALEDQAEQEKARREKARRDQQAQADRKAAEQQARDEAARKKQLAERQQAEKEKAEQAKADKAAAAQREAARQAQLKRTLALAGATGDSNATGSAQRSSGPSANYGGRIVARIKPNIVFPDAVDGNPAAIVEIRVAPDGTITGKRLVQGSGVKAWDDAVLRAIDRTDGLPRDIDGRVPPVVEIKFRPRDL